MKNFNLLIENNTRFIIFLIVSVLLTSITMIFLYENTRPNKSYLTLKYISCTINNLNSSFDNCISNSVIDPNYTIKTLQNDIKTLDCLKETLLATVVTDEKLSEMYFNLCTSIDSTKNLYNYYLNLLLDSTYDSQSITNINSLKNECIKDYEALNNSGIELYFTKATFKFFNNFDNYLNQTKKANTELLVKDLQQQEFLKSFHGILLDFYNLLDDLDPAINQIRLDGRSFSVLIDEIILKEEQFLLIKDKACNISIPENSRDYYNALNKIFDIYCQYLKSMKSTLIFESSSNYKYNKNFLDKNYKSANSKFITTKTTTEDLINEIENL